MADIWNSSWEITSGTDSRQEAESTMGTAHNFWKLKHAPSHYIIPPAGAHLLILPKQYRQAGSMDSNMWIHLRLDNRRPYFQLWSERCQRQLVLQFLLAPSPATHKTRHTVKKTNTKWNKHQTRESKKSYSNKEPLWFSHLHLEL